MIKLVNGYPNLTRSEIVDAFQEIEVDLPESYISFLLEQNGGGFETECGYVCPDDDEFQICINCFYGISKFDSSIELLCAWSSHCHCIPDSLFPIADDGIGNQICIGVTGKYLNKLYFWNKDGEVDYGEEATFDNIELICESFESFIKAIQELK